MDYPSVVDRTAQLAREIEAVDEVASCAASAPHSGSRTLRAVRVAGLAEAVRPFEVSGQSAVLPLAGVDHESDCVVLGVLDAVGRS